MFFRKPRIEALPVTMAGVRMGERLLQVGVDDAGLAAALASKVGLSGAAAHAVANESEAARARSAAASAGALVDVQVAPFGALPFESASFDLAVIHARSGWLGAMRPEERVGLLQSVHRLLRSGGRVVVIESAPRQGLAALFRSHTVNEHYAAAGGAEGALRAEGFRPVRLLGEREGYRFTEGLKT
jgi:ubiquinone/menaquinone biosynthesis C-methylase UbiE